MLSLSLKIHLASGTPLPPPPFIFCRDSSDTAEGTPMTTHHSTSGTRVDPLRDVLCRVGSPPNPGFPPAMSAGPTATKQVSYAQVARWLDAQGCTQARSHLEAEWSRRESGDDARPAVVLGEVEASRAAGDTAPGAEGDGVRRVLAALYLYVAGFLVWPHPPPPHPNVHSCFSSSNTHTQVRRGEIDQAKQVFTILTQVHPPASDAGASVPLLGGGGSAGLATLREGLCTNPAQFAADATPVELSTPRAPLLIVMAHLERGNLKFLLAALCDPQKVRTTVVPRRVSLAAAVTPAAAAGGGDAEGDDADSVEQRDAARRAARKRRWRGADGARSDGGVSAPPQRSLRHLLLQTFDRPCVVDFSDEGWAEEEAAGGADASARTAAAARRRPRPRPFAVAAESGGRLTVCRAGGDAAASAEAFSAQHGAAVTGLAVVGAAPACVLSAGVDGAARLWTRAGDALAAYANRDEAAVLCLARCAAAPSLFACGTVASYAAVWSTEHTAAPLRIFDVGRASPHRSTHVSAVCLAPDGGAAAVTADTGGTLRLWDVRAAQQQGVVALSGVCARRGGRRQRPQTPLPPPLTVYDASPSRCGRYVCVGTGGPDELRVFDLRMLRLAAAFPLMGAPVSLSHAPGTAHRLAIACSSGGGGGGAGGDGVVCCDGYTTWCEEEEENVGDGGARVFDAYDVGRSTPTYVKWTDDDVVVCATVAC